MFAQSLRRYHAKHDGDSMPWSCFWFLEFQKRGAPHFHFFHTHRIPAETYARLWYEIVGSGDQKHLKAGTRIETIKGGHRGITAYATKYAVKSEQKVVPAGFERVGRFWGVYGCRECVAATLITNTLDTNDYSYQYAVEVIKNTVRRLASEGKVRIGKHKVGSGWTAYFIHEDAARMVSTEISFQGRRLEENGISRFHWPEPWANLNLEATMTCR